MLFLFFAILTSTAAHLVRIYRWQLFTSVYEDVRRSILLRALSFGYLANMLLPFKLGDLIRAFFSGRKMKNGKALGFSSVITERILDIVVVGMIFASFLIFDKSDLIAYNSLCFYVYLMISVVIACFLFWSSKKYLKKSIKLIAGVFNQTIELKILKFSWALIRNFKDITTRISRRKLLSSTVLMWGFYILSYYFLSECVNSKSQGWQDMFVMLFSNDSLNSSGLVQFFGSSNNSLYFLMYLIIPNVLLLLFSFLPQINRNNNLADSTGKNSYINLLPHINQEERLAFLEKYFSGEHRNYIQNYLKINSDISIIRDYSAGSNATTMLCMNSSGNFFRKYAFGADGEKLYEQILWIKKFKDILPLPKIIKDEKDSDFCYYDMPAITGSVGLFEYAHSMPIEDSWIAIRNVLETLEKTLYIQNRRNSDEITIGQYIESKVLKNIQKIQNARYLKPLMKYDELIINGKPFKNLFHYLPMLSKGPLTETFKTDFYSEIHGDLTIENIICTRSKEGKDGWYLIDPNTGNVHDSPNLDYGKLLQSLSGGYEFLMNTQNVEVSENRINFIFTKSLVYENLHRKLDEFMCRNFTTERIKSIYYHHIIHWLRLMPYKIEKNGNRSVIFFAGLLMVLDEAERKFGDEV